MNEGIKWIKIDLGVAPLVVTVAFDNGLSEVFEGRLAIEVLTKIDSGILTLHRHHLSPGTGTLVINCE